MLRLWIAAVLAASGWALSNEAGAGKADELMAKLKDGKGHPKENASEAEIKSAVDQVLATK